MSKNYEQIRSEVSKKYKGKINSLEDKVKTLSEENEQLKSKLEETEAKLREKDEWIERLLEYTELDQETLKEHITKSNRLSDCVDGISTVMNRFKAGPYSTFFSDLF